MLTKRSKVIVSLSLFVTFVSGIFFVINTQKVCTNEYWENAKIKKQVENIEMCVQEKNVEAAIFLSNMYAKGDGVSRDHLKAIEVIKEFAELGNSSAMIVIADLYSCYNQYKDFDKAEFWYKKAIDLADNSSEKAKVLLAKFYTRKYYHTKDLKNIDLYIEWLKKIANEGNIDAMRLLASEYKEGEYVNRNYYTALEWLKKATEKNDVIAYRTIGNYYANGLFGDVDYKEARYWFQEASNKGDDISPNFLKNNPNPLNLEITKATVSDFKQKFK